MVNAALLISSVNGYGMLAESRRIHPPAYVVSLAAVEALRRTEGRLLNSYNRGGYLIWEARIPVYVDGRTDLYGDDFLPLYEALIAGHDWQRRLDEERIDVCLLDRTAPLYRHLAASDAWEELIRDPVASLLRRRPPSSSREGEPGP
jgi:hypothetical protein